MASVRSFRLGFWAIALVLALQGNSGTYGQRASQTGAITGRITLSDGSPLTDTRVIATDATTGPAEPVAIQALGETDRDGRYQLTDLPPGRYYIQAGTLDEPDYFPGVAQRSDAKPVVLAAGTSAAADFQISTPRFRIKGRVIRSGNSSFVGVTLNNLSVANRRRTAPISADGAFEFTNVSRGHYIVSPLHSGALSSIRIVFRRGDALLRAQKQDEMSTRTIDVVDKDVTVELLALDSQEPGPSGPPVRYSVTVEGGGPAPRVPVTLIPVSGRLYTAREWTIRERTSYEGERLPAGEYRLSLAAIRDALPARYTIRSVTAGGKDLLNTTFNTATGTLSDLKIELAVSPPPWAKVRGRIIGLEPADRGGEATITASGPSLLKPLSTPLESDGSFEFPMMPPGTYRLERTPETGQFHASIIVGNTVENKDLTDIEIPAISPLLDVLGRVTDPRVLEELKRNQGLASTSLIGIPDPFNEPVVQVPLLSDGSFRLVNVPPGAYLWGVSTCHYDVCDGYYSETPIPVTDHTLELSVVTEPVTIEGSVTVDGGAPVPRFVLAFTDADIPVSDFIDNATFSVKQPPGPYKVSILDLPAGYRVKSARNGDVDLLTDALIVKAGSPRPRIAITLGSDR